MERRIPVNPEKLSPASRRSYGIPEYWQDQQLSCTTCGKSFPFTAEEQREWYEGKQRHICNQPVLCPRCFLETSQRRRLKSRMDYAFHQLKSSPTADAKLEAAETILRYFQNEQHGDLALAQHLLREILHDHPTHPHALDLSAVVTSLLRGKSS